MSDSKIVKASFVAMSDIRKEIRKVDPDDPKIIGSYEEAEEVTYDTTEEESEQAIDDDVIDGSVSIILENAKDEAALILNEAREMAERIKADAKQEGYDLGYQEAMAAADKSLAQQRRLLEQKAIEMDEAYEEMLREAEPIMAEVIGDLVENMVGHYAGNQEVIMFLVRLALSEISTYGAFVIKVAPDDYDYVLARKEELDREVGDKVSLEIVKDSSLNPMDCLIETAYGNVDASLSLRRESLKKELRLIAGSLRRASED